jgi:hypothetical protein
LLIDRATKLRESIVDDLVVGSRYLISSRFKSTIIARVDRRFRKLSQGALNVSARDNRGATDG